MTTDLHRAEMLKTLLLEKGMRAIVLNKKDSSFGWGVCRVYVREEDVQAAKDFLHKNVSFT